MSNAFVGFSFNTFYLQTILCPDSFFPSAALLQNNVVAAVSPPRSTQTQNISDLMFM
jgi:hypothetical protein